MLLDVYGIATSERRWKSPSLNFYKISTKYLHDFFIAMDFLNFLSLGEGLRKLFISFR